MPRAGRRYLNSVFHYGASMSKLSEDQKSRFVVVLSAGLAKKQRRMSVISYGPNDADTNSDEAVDRCGICIQLTIRMLQRWQKASGLLLSLVDNLDGREVQNAVRIPHL